MKRMLVIPAAGRGSRLGFEGPKALCPVGGRPMIDYLVERYVSLIDRIVVVASPGAVGAFNRHLASCPVPADCVVQPEPNGMLPAILCARPLIAAHQPAHVWVTWCDQIGISDDTVHRLASEAERHPDAALILPTVKQEPPYIHLERDASGRIVRVLHRRDGDEMPPSGESDAGLFDLRVDTYLERLVEYDRSALVSLATGERNFLPFIPWLAAQAEVRSFPLTDAREAIGINTAADLLTLEAYLRERP
jgi:bifunctional N-acetylglucosamine-1-phosphate-uridyltransferase/glucosamine-1-phosphate-acetyltransferase GlmU-like protein